SAQRRGTRVRGPRTRARGATRRRPEHRARLATRPGRPMHDQRPRAAAGRLREGCGRTAGRPPAADDRALGGNLHDPARPPPPDRRRTAWTPPVRPPPPPPRPPPRAPPR